MLIIDDYMRNIRVSFFKEKYKVFDKFKFFKTLAKTKTDCKLKSLRFDRGGEFTSREFDDFCEEHGIIRQFIIGNAPRKNGMVDVRNQDNIERGVNQYCENFKLSFKKLKNTRNTKNLFNKNSSRHQHKNLVCDT